MIVFTKANDSYFSTLEDSVMLAMLGLT